MQYLDLTLSSITENLALDEALLNDADRMTHSAPEGELLRIWESPTIAVVVGRGTQVEKEIDCQACEQDGVPILRRCSGGTSVVAGPGCLMYAVLISYAGKPELRSVDAAHEYVMSRMKSGLSELSNDVAFRGLCDLTVGEMKFSGNALRCKRNFFLYHGTVLYDFSLNLISKYLATPPREPAYRKGRDHASFVTNFPSSAQTIKKVIRDCWNAQTQVSHWPRQMTRELVNERYSQSSWNRRR